MAYNTIVLIVYVLFKCSFNVYLQRKCWGHSHYTLFFSFHNNITSSVLYFESTWEMILPNADLRAHELLLQMNTNLR